MAQRVLWDKDEALIMCDALVKVLRGEIKREVAVKNVSETLRERAVAKGMEIDNVFRNIAGINFQMSTMEYMLTDGKHGIGKGQKLFKEVTDLYKNDIDEYEKLLKQTKESIIQQLAEKPSIKNKYFIWLAERVSPTKIPDYKSIYTDIESFCLKKKILKNTLFQTTDFNSLYKVSYIISSHRNFIYKRNHKKYLSALKYYQDFLKEHHEFIKGSSVKYDHEKNDTITFATPMEKSILGDTHDEETALTQKQQYVGKSEESHETWKPASVSTLFRQKGFSVNKHIMEEQKNASNPDYTTENISKDTGNLLDSGKEKDREYSKDKEFKDSIKSELQNNVHLDNDIVSKNNCEIQKSAFKEWLAKFYASESDISVILFAIDQCILRIEKHNLFSGNLWEITDIEFLTKLWEKLFAISDVYWTNKSVNNRMSEAFKKYIEFITVKNEDINKSKDLENVNKGNESITDEIDISEKYSTILKLYFSENGYELYSSISQDTFQQDYFEIFHCQPEFQGNDLDEVLKQLGTELDGYIFPKVDEKQKKVANEIINAVNSTFNTGVKAVYLQAIFDKYRYPLTSMLHVYDKDTLAQFLLKYLKEKCVQEDDLLVQIGQTPTFSNDLINVIKEFYEPVTVEKIHEKLWYIPYKEIKSLCYKTESLINMRNDKYFYAPNFPINPAELNQLKEIIYVELASSNENYIMYKELYKIIKKKFPIMAENFSELESQKCIACLLRDYFEFKGSIITFRGNKLNLNRIYAEFARSCEAFQLDDLKEFSKNIEKPISWEGVLDESIRISSEQFKRKDFVKFNVKEIDAKLEEVCPGRYIALKDVFSYTFFPNIGFPWNIFVLESYLYKYSEIFKLIHSSFSEDCVCGAMVRVNASINEYDDLMVEVLAHSNVLTSEEEALEYIVDQGYQKIRKYKIINKIIKKAKKLKEQYSKK